MALFIYFVLYLFTLLVESNTGRHPCIKHTTISKKLRATIALQLGDAVQSLRYYHRPGASMYAEVDHFRYVLLYICFV